MAVEDVNKPKTVNKVDPRAATEKGEGAVTYWEIKAKEARARHDYLAEEEAMKMLGKTTEPAFQVKGTVNLGDINPQEQAKQAQERADKIIESKDKDIKAANEKAAEAENKLQAEKIDSLRRDFATQMDVLNKTIEKMTTTKDARPLHEQFKEQYTTVLDLAKGMGLERTSTGRDPMVDIKLAEMNYENARRDREWQLQLKESDRKWQMDLQELKDKREFRERELVIQAKRDEMIFSAPAVIGAAIAKGLAESAQGGGAPPGGGIQNQPGSPQAFKGQAAEGESGEIECPSCHAMVGVGPTTTSAECAWCHSQFDIERGPAAGSAAETLVAEEEK